MSHIERETPSYNQLSISACMRQATIQSCSKRATSNTFSAHHKFRNAIAVVYLQFYLAVIWWQRLLLHRYCGVYAQCTVRACSLSLCIVVSICVFLSVFVVSSARCGRWVSLIFFFCHAHFSNTNTIHFPMHLKYVMHILLRARST